MVALIAYVIAILAAIILHEQAHALVAYWNGDLTAKFCGRLTLNPLKHIDWMGMLCMLLVGFGWAKPVPIDPRNFKRYKTGMITTSLAGVTVNLIMALLSFGGLAIMANAIPVSSIEMFSAAYYAYLFFECLLLCGATFNITLMAFNLLPLYPLDGFRVVETLVKPNNKYVNFMYRYGSFVLIGLLLVSSLLGRFLPQLDLFGQLIRWLLTGFRKLFGLV